MNLKSVSNNKLKLLRKLNRKKYRYREQLFLIEGVRSVQQVLENGTVEVRELFFDESQNVWKQSYWENKSNKIQSSAINKTNFKEVSDTLNPQGIIAMCSMPAEIETNKLTKQGGIIIAADAIQDPGNMGTIIRTAAWFGVKGLLAGKGTVDLFHPKVARSSAGSIGMLPFKNVQLKTILPQFEKNGWQVVLLDASENRKLFFIVRKWIELFL